VAERARGHCVCGEESAGFVAADRTIPFAVHAALAVVDLEWLARGSAEFDNPVRRLRPAAAPAFFFCQPSLDVGDPAVDAVQTHGVPDPQGVQAFQVGRQVVGHFVIQSRGSWFAYSRYRILVR
jgi:hypothetical protein